MKSPAPSSFLARAHRAALRAGGSRTASPRSPCWGAMVPAHALRIKEVAAVQGVRSNQLTGYGLVVGLDGTGDQTTQMPITTQALTNYLQQMGISLPPGTAAPQLKNVAT